MKEFTDDQYIDLLVDFTERVGKIYNDFLVENMNSPGVEVASICRNVFFNMADMADKKIKSYKK